MSAIAVRDNDIYLGGNFTSMGGQPRNRIAKVSPDGTLDPNFNPNATGGNIPGVDTIVVTSSDVYVGGDFSAIGGQPRIDLAKLNPITGLVDGAGRGSAIRSQSMLARRPPATRQALDLDDPTYPLSWLE